MNSIGAHSIAHHSNVCFKTFNSRFTRTDKEFHYELLFYTLTQIKG